MMGESKTFENFSATACNLGVGVINSPLLPLCFFEFNLFYIQLSIMNAEQNDTSYDVIT